MLQRLLDSARTAPAVSNSAAPKKDSLKQVARALPKKDSARLHSYIADSLLYGDSTITILPGPILPDSLASISRTALKKPLTWQQDTAFMNLLKIPYVKKKIQPLLQNGDLRMPVNKDFLFYVLTGLILFVALIKQLFPKYFFNLFRLLFEASFRQKQRREQLMQETLPSLLMNILFVLTGGLMVALIADHYGWLKSAFWWLVLYSITILALAYMFKYMVIQFTGWVFNARESASTYSFIVFLINKMIGVALLPLMLLLAFSSGHVWDISITLAAGLVILLLVFRYIISLRIIRGTLNINPLHFFIYLCAVELMPMLIIYKVLFNFTGKSN
jgi:Domain of unknown function (DUF4271)